MLHIGWLGCDNISDQCGSATLSKPCSAAELGRYSALDATRFDRDPLAASCNLYRSSTRLVSNILVYNFKNWEDRKWKVVLYVVYKGNKQAHTSTKKSQEIWKWFFRWGPEIARSADHETAAHYTDLRRWNLTVSLPSTWAGTEESIFHTTSPSDDTFKCLLSPRVFLFSVMFNWTVMHSMLRCGQLRIKGTKNNILYAAG